MPNERAPEDPQDNQVWANDAAQRLAERAGIGPEEVVGSGQNGTRTVKDVRYALEQKHRDQVLALAVNAMGAGHRVTERVIDAIEGIRPQAYPLGAEQERIIELHEKLTEALEGPFGPDDQVRRFTSDRTANFGATVPYHPNPNDRPALEHRAPDLPREEPRRLPIGEAGERNGHAGPR